MTPFPNAFTKQDKQKVVDFLNFIATKAKFQDMSVKEVIELTKLLNAFQSTILTKIEKSIVDEVEIIEAKEETN